MTTDEILHSLLDSLEELIAPAGWAIVPTEATPEMIEAAMSQDSDAIDPRTIIAEDYRAMIANRPTPPRVAARD